MLNGCIIDKRYRLPDDWIHPIRFTELGQKIIFGCLKANARRLKPNDVHFSVFLTFGCSDGMFVDLATDIDALRSQLSKEILAGRIKYPYILGRELHDTAAELYPGQTRLDNNQTLRVLDKLPVGVFQKGRTVVGPYGCTYSDVPRSLRSSSLVPGYLCPSEACGAVHKIQLETGDASINKARGIVAGYIRKNRSPGPDGHLPLVSKSVMLDSGSQFSTANLFDVLSDGLDVEELRGVVDNLLRMSFKDPGRRMDISKRLSAAIINPSDFVLQLDRARLMQIVLLHSDRDIVHAVDNVISQGTLKIQDFEVRVSKVTRWTSSNQAIAEIGAFGARFTSSTSSMLIALRMKALLHKVYYESGIWDAGDLAYAIEAPNGLSDGELLDRATRQYSIRELFTKLVLPNRRAAGIAAEELQIFQHDSISREELLEHFCWKIGEPDGIKFTDLSRIEEHLPDVRQANEESTGLDSIRSSAVVLFTALEDTLNRALTFCTWAFTEDHYLAKEGFLYDPAADPAALEFIESSAPAEHADLVLRSDGRNTLMPLGAGFARLAKALRNLKEDSCLRPEKDIPPECLALHRPFAFPYTRSFLNLTDSARSEVLTALQAAARYIQNVDVIDLRNWTVHGNKQFPGKDRVASALRCIDELQIHLLQTGLYPRLYEMVCRSRDSLGREELTYTSGNDGVAMYRPGWAIAPRLPLGQARLILIPIAKTESSGPLRFRLKKRPGRDPYWEGWPIRWPARSSYLGAENVPVDSGDLAETG